MSNLVTILKIEYVIEKITEVTFINEEGRLEMIKLSNELMEQLLDVDKLRLIITNR